MALVAVVGLGACSTSGTPTAAPTFPGFPSNIGGTPSIAAAKAGFEKVLEKDPRDQYAWYDLGVIAESEKDPKAAADDYKRAIAIQGNFESALYNLGLMRLQAHDYPTAVALLSRAAAANPKDANALFQLGLALANLHTAATDARALVELRAAGRIDPKLLEAVPTGLFGPTSTTRAR